MSDGSDDRRPQQSGMETKHEAWVLATINFLGRLGVQTFENKEWTPKRAAVDDTLRRGRTLDIPKRLEILEGTIRSNDRRLGRAEREIRAEKEAHSETRAHLRVAEDLLVRIWREMNSPGPAVPAIVELEMLLRARQPDLFGKEDEDDSRTT